MPKLSIPNLILQLERQRVRLYEIYIDLVNVEMAERVLHESIVLQQIIATLRSLT